MKKPEIKHNRKMTNHEVLSLYHGLKALKGVSGIKLVYAINRTIGHLKPLAEAFTQSALIPMPEKFKEYQKELKEYYRQAATDSKGTPRVKADIGPDGQVLERYDVDLNDPKTMSGKLKIDKKYEDVIESYTKDVEEYNQWLDQECEEEIKIHYVSLTHAPEVKDHYDVVAPLIKEMTPEQETRWNELFQELISD